MLKRRRNEKKKKWNSKILLMFFLAAAMLAGQAGIFGFFPDSVVLASQSSRTGISMQAEDSLSGEGILEIEAEHIYENMKTAWSAGYEPVVKDGFVKIVLPLFVKDGTELSCVSTALRFDETKDSPFVIRNYKKTVRQENIMAQDGSKQDLFLVCFDLELSENRVNGIYPVTVSVQYPYQGSVMTQTFLIYVRITDGKIVTDAASDEEARENVTPSETSVGENEIALPAEPITYDDTSVQTAGTGEEIASSEPKVILSGCHTSAESLQAGGSITVTAILKNTNSKKYVQNMTVTVTVQEPGISLETDSNVFYIERLGAGKTTELPLMFTVSEQTLAGKYPVSMELSYDNPVAVPLTSSVQFNLNVAQSMDVGFEVGAYTDQMNAGDSVSIPVQAMNMGRDMIYNVRCELDVPGLEEKTSLYLGNLDGGTAAEGELTAFAGMVNPLAENEAERYGITVGTLVLIYEDASGNEYRQSEEIRATIQSLAIADHSGEEVEEAPKTGRQLLIGVIVIAAAVAGLLWIPKWFKKRERSEVGE